MTYDCIILSGSGSWNAIERFSSGLGTVDIVASSASH